MKNIRNALLAIIMVLPVTALAGTIKIEVDGVVVWTGEGRSVTTGHSSSTATTFGQNSAIITNNSGVVVQQNGGTTVTTVSPMEIEITVSDDLDQLTCSGCTLEIARNAGRIDASGASVRIDGDVVGDIDANGGTITIEGDLNGNIHAIGGTINHR